MSQPEYWSFVQDNHIFSAKTLSLLIEALKRYRKNGLKPEGDPEHEIALEYLKTHPWLVEELDDEAIQKEDHTLSFIRRVWSGEIASSRREKDDEFAVKKMSVCHGCPAFSPAKFGDGEQTRRAYILTNHMIAKKIPITADAISKMGYCTHHKWVCSVAASIPVDDAKMIASPDSPAICWVHDSPKEAG